VPGPIAVIIGKVIILAGRAAARVHFNEPAILHFSGRFTSPHLATERAQVDSPPLMSWTKKPCAKFHRASWRPRLDVTYVHPACLDALATSCRSATKQIGRLLLQYQEVPCDGHRRILTAE
jgi:hypothetical protein